MDQDRRIADLSGKPPRAIKQLVRAGKLERAAKTLERAGRR
jgi:hypothetical protein